MQHQPAALGLAYDDVGVGRADIVAAGELAHRALLRLRGERPDGRDLRVEVLAGQAVLPASRWPLIAAKVFLPATWLIEAGSTPCRPSFQANRAPYALSISVVGCAVSKLPMADIAKEYSL